GGYDGDGESVAVVAFSGYRPSDVAAYQACFGSSVPVSDRVVGRATANRTGSAEVALDVETVISAAPGLDAVHVYIDGPAGTRSCGTTSPVPAAAVSRGSGRGRDGRRVRVSVTGSRTAIGRCPTSHCTRRPTSTAIPSTAPPGPAGTPAG